MPDWKDVPLLAPPYENVDDVQVDQWAATIIDFVPVIVEGKLHLVKRPGLTPWLNLGTGLPIDGLYWFDKKRVALAVSAGRVWKIIDNGGTNVELLGSTALLKSALVTFADDGNRCVMANGGPMVHTDLSSLSAMADPDAPQRVSHVAILDGYLHGNSVETGRNYFSSVTDILDWNALDFFEAEARPDDIVAMKEAYRELIVLGRESVEFFANDGVTPFSRISGSAQPFGTEAPYSLAQIGPSWMWLDHKRRLVTMEGRAVQAVSSPYDRVIQEMASVDDAIGYTVSISGYPIYLLNFPTARTTLAYNYETKQWHKWGYWDRDRAIYQRFRGQTYCYARSWNAHLIGDYKTGIIYKASRNVYTDAGNPIRSLIRTGHISHGAEFTKRSNVLRVHAKRAQGNADVEDPQLMLRRRVDGGPRWSNERWKSLGKVGEHRPYLDWRRNGVYRRCQYELIHSDPSDCILTGAQENIDILGR